MNYIKKVLRADKKINRYICLGGIGLSLLVLLLFLSKTMDFIFISNDDIYIQAILSGDITGVPNAHVIYVLYPLAWLITMLYRAIPSVSWYGIFIVGVHILCWGIVISKIVALANTKLEQLRNFFLSYFFLFFLDLKWVMFSQYTALAGLIGATAILCFATIEDEEQLSKYTLSIFLMLISFMLRSSAALMCIPFLFTFMIYKLVSCYFVLKNIQKKNKLLKIYVFYSFVLGLLMSGMFGIHTLAYQSDEWKQYDQYNTYRTEVYDYYLFPSYEGNEEFYNSLNIPKEEMHVIISANLELDKNVTSETMKEIYEKSKDNKEHKIQISELPRRLIFDYLDSFDVANRELMAVYLLYGALLILAIIKKRESIWIGIILTFIIRSGMKSYLIYMERLPDRVASPLTIIEFCTLLAILIFELRGKKKEKEPYEVKSGLLKIEFIVVFLFLFLLLADVYKENLDRNLEIKNEVGWTENLFPYLMENEEKIYLLEVSSIASMKGPVFGDQNDFPENAITLGGWLQKSPIMEQQYINMYGSKFENEDFFAENTYIVQLQNLPTLWLEEYFTCKGYTVEVQETSYIENNEKRLFSILKLNEIK